MRTNAPLGRIPSGIWVLGMVSMLMDISSEIIHGLLPLFLVGPLGASALVVGLIEGLAESATLFVKVFSGMLSDHFGNRKALAVLGYSVGALTKPLFAIASTAGVVLTARLLDRVGKGVREPERRVGGERSNPIRRENLKRLGGAYWWVVGIGAVFALARFSEAFLVLRARQGGIPVAYVPLAMVAMNLTYSGSAYPFGRLLDRTDHGTLMGLVLKAWRQRRLKRIRRIKHEDNNA